MASHVARHTTNTTITMRPNGHAAGTRRNDPETKRSDAGLGDSPLVPSMIAPFPKNPKQIYPRTIVSCHMDAEVL